MVGAALQLLIYHWGCIYHFHRHNCSNKSGHARTHTYTRTRTQTCMYHMTRAWSMGQLFPIAKCQHGMPSINPHRSLDHLAKAQPRLIGTGPSAILISYCYWHEQRRGLVLLHPLRLAEEPCALCSIGGEGHV